MKNKTSVEDDEGIADNIPMECLITCTVKELLINTNLLLQVVVSFI